MWRRIEEVFRNHPARVIALVAAAYVLALVLGAGFALLQSGRAGDELLITPQVTDTLPSRATRDAVDTRPTSMPPPGETLPPPPGTNPPAATAQPPATTPVPSPTQFAGTPPQFTNTPTAPAGTVTFPTPPPPTATGTPTPTARPGETVVPPTSTTGSTPYPPDASATALAMLLTTTAQAAALPTNVPGVTIVSQGFYIDYAGDLVLLGEVRNDTTRLLGSIGIQFWVYDANQYLLGADSLASDLYVLLSGETSSFGWSISVEDPGLVSRVEYRVVEAPDGEDAPVEGVKVLSQEVDHDGVELIITGTVENTSDVMYASLIMYAIVRDPSTHEPVRRATMTGSIQNLMPDETADFELRADDVSSLDEDDIRYYMAAG
jgi:hypothetical protein